MLTEMPHRHDEVLTVRNGVGRTIDAFGSSLRARYYRTTVDEANYTELRYLGYFTNNGAAYYYNTLHGNASYTGGPAEFYTFTLLCILLEENVNLNFYSETFDAVYKEAQSKGIPYRYYHLDSFMYPKQSGDEVVCDLSVAHSSGGNGLIVWDGCKELFPNGLSDVQESA